MEYQRHLRRGYTIIWDPFRDPLTGLYSALLSFERRRRCNDKDNVDIAMNNDPIPAPLVNQTALTPFLSLSPRMHFPASPHKRQQYYRPDRSSVSHSHMYGEWVMFMSYGRCGFKGSKREGKKENPRRAKCQCTKTTGAPPVSVVRVYLDVFGFTRVARTSAQINYNLLCRPLYRDAYIEYAGAGIEGWSTLSAPVRMSPPRYHPHIPFHHSAIYILTYMAWHGIGCEEYRPEHHRSSDPPSATPLTFLTLHVNFAFEKGG